MKFLLAFVLAFNCIIVFSQADSQFKDSVNTSFLKHLQKEKLWDEGLHFLKSYKPTVVTNYYNGLFNYQSNNIDSSIFFFKKIQSNSIYWDQSRLLTSFQLAYKGNLNESDLLLDQYNPDSELLKGVKNLQKGGITLLNRDLKGFETFESSFGGHYQLTPYESELSIRKQRIMDLKHKSPFVAGFLSGIIPGAGRFYIGKGGEGVATILVTGIFALQSMEAYRKDGPESLRFIIFSSLLSVTYISNIWGTVLSVKVANLEKNKQINEDILLNMHIPMRVIFN